MPCIEGTALNRYLAVFKTSISAESGGDAAQPLAAAKQALQTYSQQSSADMQALHVASWNALHSSKIELAGDGDTGKAVATAVNSSMFYLLSAARVDWPFSTSPGGLANNAYLGQCDKLPPPGPLIHFVFSL